MIRRWVGFLSLVIGWAFSADSAAQESSFPRYEGEIWCFSCHGIEGAATGCSLEPIPKHARAFRALQSVQAPEIAVLSGVITPPAQTLVCLECHSAGGDDGRRWWGATFRPQDGVQCETCHGPGSLHVLSPTTAKLRRATREECSTCHTPRSSHEEVLGNGFTRAPADLGYKTPVNLTVSPDGARLYVVCEHSDSVVVVDTRSAVVVGEVKVGSRPHAAALDSRGQTLFVTNRMSGTLSMVDVEGLRSVAEIAVGAEPHGVRVDHEDRYVYVANTGEDSISVVDAASRKVVRRLTGGAGPWSVALRPDGPVAAVTNVRPQPSEFRSPPQSELTLIDLGNARVLSRRVVDQANMLQGVAWIPQRKVGLFTLMRTKNLVPVTRLAQGWVITNGLGILQADGHVDQVLLDEPNHAFPDPMDLAVSPDGRWAMVTSGGADEVAIVDVAKLLQLVAQTDPAERAEVLPDHLGKSRHFVAKRIRVGANPRGVCFAPDGRLAYVANALDDSVSVIDVSALGVLRTISLAGPSEITQLRQGERLFHSAAITHGRQFSCRSCHPDGHENGLTFDIEADGLGLKPVDNRSLRGVFDTAPFKWEGTNPTLHRQCGPRFAVFFTRRAPYTPEELNALVRYMGTIERAPNRYRSPEGLSEPQRRGKAIFERTVLNDGAPLELENRCNHCHIGAYRTSRKKSAVATTMWFDAPVEADLTELFNADEYGELGSYYFMDVGLPSEAFDVPHLIDIAAGPPFLHNGAARTLEEIWTRFNMVNHHGATHDLTRRQFNDLIAYLKTQ